MLTNRIIPCLDVKDGKVVKGVKFKDHEVLGDIVDLAEKYSLQGADELVFYDITASAERRVVDTSWIEKVASVINIPFCVSGGIKSVADAERVLKSGADKISINSPALDRPELIRELANRFGRQCVVVGVDSKRTGNKLIVWKYTGSTETAQNGGYNTIDWVKKVEKLGAGEIVLNCMNSDGVKAGYDIEQLNMVRKEIKVPLIASGGAGQMSDFIDVFEKTKVDGALAASVFHKNLFTISELKFFLAERNINVRP